MTRVRALVRLAGIIFIFAAGSLAYAPVPRSAPQPAMDSAVIPAASGIDPQGPVDLPVVAESSRDIAGTRSEAPDSSRASDGKASVAATPVPRPRPTTAPPKASPAPTPTSQIAKHSPRPLLRPVAAGIHTPTLKGGGSWYGTGGPGMYAAMRDFKDGARVVVSVCAFPNGKARCLALPVSTQCAACRWSAGSTLIDLSVPAYLFFGYSLERGIIPVTVTFLEGAP